MTTSTFPGALDAFSTKVDGVDDVMADHINYPQSAIVAVEALVRNEHLIKNTSGSTVAAGDLGYIDDAGEFKLTTVVADIRRFAVVLSGAATGSDIVVTTGGRVTVNYNGSAAAAGDYLVSTNIAANAVKQTFMSSAVFGVALAASGGSVVSALLLDFGQKPAVAENLLADSLTHEASWLAGTALNDLADDNYAGALWNILNDANAPDVSGTAGGSTDTFTRCLTITLDATTRVGAVQFLTAEKTRPLRGQVVSLSADLWATGITAARMAVAVWTGAADAVTSDLVSSWAANPTLATSWAFIGTPASIAITAGQARYSVQNLLIPTNAANLAVFIWTPNQEVSTDALNIARVKLEPGAVATDFVGRDPGEELALVSRFYAKSYSVGVAPGTNTLVNMAMAEGFTTSLASTNNAEFPVAMRTTPTITLYSTAGTANKISTSVPADIGTTVTATNSGDRRIPTVSDSGAGLTAGGKYFFHYTADARL